MKEMKMLECDPPPGICAWAIDESLNHLRAQVKGPQDTPYSKGIFYLDIQVPTRYPFDPPKVRFLNRIYHPNIDVNGRICLDTLKMPPSGSWAPSINIPTLLTTIRTLMAHPNGDDGLMPDITKIFLDDRALFEANATACTLKYASDSISKDFELNRLKSDEIQGQINDRFVGIDRLKQNEMTNGMNVGNEDKNSISNDELSSNCSSDSNSSSDAESYNSSEADSCNRLRKRP
eukprot:CAMPEP_0171456642 /NCGR_PEP_ID=MMETSP0945-20130129/3043_1 /TAXON_ID=109269 /ORGANISM="Vaucheria litorea, Strain CCMP2940" /LENGTH=232 /DNA_ID=CAMNT_0011982099 /DNA_START=22 /DNA_END=717 /DNA_ORIENTATION=-